MAVRNRRPGKDEGCCSVHFLKYVLFIFNFIFYLAGIAILGIGLWTLFFKSHYVVLLATKTYSVTTYVMIAAGIIVLLVGVLGCIGAAQENRLCLLLFTFSLLLIFLMEVVAGVLAYVYSEQVDKELQKNLQRTLKTQYGIDGAVTEATDKLHERHGCCGAVDFQDWTDSAWHNETNFKKRKPGDPVLHVPHVCCRTINRKTCGEWDHPSNIYYDGCMVVLKDEIKDHETILFASGVGISVVQIFGMIISCCLYVKLKDYEDLNQRKKRTNGSY